MRDIDLKNRFISMCKQFKICTSVEVGAHEASFSRVVGSIPEVISIIAFEASPFVWKKYRPGIPENIDYRNQAVTDKTGPTTFYVQQNKSPSETVNNSILQRTKIAQTQEVIVESITLDQLLPIKSPAALWIDAEGASREVLLGGTEFLVKTALVYLEVEHERYWQNQWLFKDVLKFLETNGFLLHSIREQYVNQSNCIFINPAFYRGATLSNFILKIRHFVLPQLIGLIVWRAKLYSLKSIFHRRFIRSLVSRILSLRNSSKTCNR